MATLEEQADELLREFDAWFQKQGNEPLIHAEKAITKTFIWWLKNVRNTNPIPEDTCDK